MLSKLGWDHHCSFHALIAVVSNKSFSLLPLASVIGLLIPTAVRCISLKICPSCFIIHIIGIEYHLVNIFSLKLHRKSHVGEFIEGTCAFVGIPPLTPHTEDLLYVGDVTQDLPSTSAVPSHMPPQQCKIVNLPRL